MREDISKKLQELAEATNRKCYAKLELEEAQIEFKNAIALCDKLSDELVKLQKDVVNSSEVVSIDLNNKEQHDSI